MRLALVLLTGCAVGEWREVTVRVPPPERPLPAPDPTAHRRLSQLYASGSCSTSGLPDNDLAETIREFARAHMAGDQDRIFVTARTELSALTSVDPYGGYRSFYCIGVVKSGITTTLVIHGNGGFIR
jgi:hypothetical protein